MATKKPKFIFGIPNLVTIFRIVLTPFFIIFLLKGLFISALLVLAIAAISDAVDGFVARYFNQKTVLGTYLDPAADKFLLISAFISLFILKVVPIWLVIIAIFREIIIIFGLLVLIVRNRYYKVKPSILSKYNTTMQIFIIFESLFILIEPNFDIFHKFLCFVLSFVTFLSGLQYIYIWINLLKEVDQDIHADG